MFFSAKKWILALAASLAIWHIALAFQWQSTDSQPPAWDPAVHLGTALDYREAWREGRWLDLIRTKARPGHPQYPVAYHYSLLPILSADKPHEAVVFLNLFYLFILIGAAASMAGFIGGPRAAAAALLVTGLSPGLLYKFREAFPDLSLAAWTTLAYALVMRSEGFKHRGPGIAAGVAAGLALMSKWGAALYLLPAVFWGLKDRDRRRHLSQALLIAMLAALPWYLVNIPTMLPRIWTSVTLGHHQGQPLTWTWDNWFFYPRFLIACFGLPGLLLLLWGTASLIIKNPRPAALCLVGWLGFSYLFCTAVPSKDDRYFLPAAAALPVLGAAGLGPAGLAAAAGLSFWHARFFRKPDPRPWPAEEILSDIEARRGSRPAWLCLLANHWSLNSTSLSYMARQKGIKSLYFGGYQSELPEWSDFVLVKTRDPGPFLSDATRRILAAEKDPRSLFRRVFRPAKTWDMPDGSQAVLYEQKPGLTLLSGSRRFKRLPVRKAVLFDVSIKSRGGGLYELRAERLELPNIAAPIRDVRALLEGARIIEDGGRLYVLGLRRVNILSARQKSAELASALSRRSGLNLALTGQGQSLRAETSVAGLRLEVLFSSSGEPLIAIKEARLAGLKLPLPRLDFKRSLAPRPPSQPYSLELAPLAFSPEELSIGG